MGFFSTIVIIALFHGIAAEGLGQEGNKDTRFAHQHPTDLYLVICLMYEFIKRIYR